MGRASGRTRTARTNPGTAFPRGVRMPEGHVETTGLQWHGGHPGESYSHYVWALEGLSIRLVSEDSKWAASAALVAKWADGHMAYGIRVPLHALRAAPEIFWHRRQAALHTYGLPQAIGSGRHCMSLQASRLACPGSPP
eukprot:1793315-Amphidinium_carterae.9